MVNKLENNIQTSSLDEDEVSLQELFSLLWKEKVSIILISFVFGVSSILYTLSMPNEYRASVLLAPAHSSSGALSGALEQFGTLSSLAGVNLDQATDESKIAQEVMKSWSFIDRFINENNISLEIFAVEGWDSSQNQLDVDEDIYDPESDQWLIENEKGELGPPSSWTLYEAFKKRLNVSVDKRTGLTSISIEYYSPEVAKKWVDLYVSSINAYMQKRKVIKTARNIDYLEAQIQKNSISEIEIVLFSIVEEQFKEKMLAEANPDYAFVTVSPSMVPEEKSSPKRFLIFILVTTLGFFSAIIYLLIRNFYKTSGEN